MTFGKYKLALFLLIGILLGQSKSFAQDAANERHIEVSLRMIGHQVLLHSMDSTSRVLPIIKEQGRYKIQFESEFEFEPAKLVSIVDQVVKETRLAKTYILEVEDCASGEVVYSFEVDDLEQSDIIPCTGRVQPLGCYNLLFTLIETRWSNTALLSTNSDDPNGALFNTKTIRYSIITTLLILFISLIYIAWKRRKEDVIDPNLISIGHYQFDKLHTELLIDDQKIELTSKEADLLMLLNKAVNTTVERDVILNEVWGDEGGYVGRTLDVFISKLRKKLEADSNVKIVNVRGVGYKLIAI